MLLLKNHTSKVWKWICTFLKLMSNFRSFIIIGGPCHVMKQETEVPYTFKSWSEELHREHALFIAHKIHIISTRESYFPWHSKIRQPEKHTVGVTWVEPQVKCSDHRTASLSYPCHTSLLLIWIGFVFSKDFSFMNHSSNCLIWYLCSVVTEEKEIIMAFHKILVSVHLHCKTAVWRS